MDPRIKKFLYNPKYPDYFMVWNSGAFCYLVKRDSDSRTFKEETLAALRYIISEGIVNDVDAPVLIYCFFDRLSWTVGSGVGTNEWHYTSEYSFNVSTNYINKYNELIFKKLKSNELIIINPKENDY